MLSDQSRVTLHPNTFVHLALTLLTLAKTQVRKEKARMQDSDDADGDEHQSRVKDDE
jgi:hypothetical protein